MSILLDTNIVSELLRPPRTLHQVFAEWFRTVATEEVFLSRISEAEMKYGAYGHSDSVQRDRLLKGLRGLSSQFSTLEFSPEAVEHAARFRGMEKRRGHPVDFADGAIAGIAMANDCALATRNTKDFEGSDLILINPFEPTPGRTSS